MHLLVGLLAALVILVSMKLAARAPSRAPSIAARIGVGFMLAASVLFIVGATSTVIAGPAVVALAAVGAAVIVTNFCLCLELDVRYLLSKVIPVPMSSVYGVMNLTAGGEPVTERATWVQWRSRILFHRREQMRQPITA